MASKDGGGGGGLGWTVLGFLAGVAATLAVQTLMSSDRGRVMPPEAAVTHITTIQAEPAARAPATHMARAAASSHPSAASVAAQDQDEVADDAAAAGMTSRTPSSSDQNAAGN